MPKLTLRDLFAVGRMAPRFSVRTLLCTVLIVAAGLGFTRWWFAPTVKVGYYDNGGVAVEQWEQRDWFGRFRHMRTVRYYPSGQKSYECGPGGLDRRIWTPAGEYIDERTVGTDAFWQMVAKHRIGFDVDQPSPSN